MWNINYEDPKIHIGKMFNDIVDLRFCPIQHSVNMNFNFSCIRNENKRHVVRCNGHLWEWYVRAKETPR